MWCRNDIWFQFDRYRISVDIAEWTYHELDDLTRTELRGDECVIVGELTTLI